MTEKELHAIIQSLIYLGLNPGQELNLDDSGAMICASTLPFTNRAYIAHADTKTLNTLNAYFGNTPHTLWAVANNQELKQFILDSHKYLYATQFPVMIADVTSITCDDLPKGVFIKQAVSDEEVAVWINLVSQIYGSDKNEFTKFITYLRNCPASSDILLFTVFVNDVPAATSMLINHPKAAELHWVGTIPEFRGKGLGKLVSAYPYHDKGRLRSSTAALFASPMGKSLYEKIGFRVVALVDVYKMNPSPMNNI